MSDLTSQEIPKRVTLRLDGENTIRYAAKQLLSSGRSNTVSDALKSLMKPHEVIDIESMKSDIDQLMKFQLQTLALLQRHIGSHDENMIRLSKGDARSMYQQIRDRDKCFAHD